jgi:hypothetical protein
MKEPKIPKTSCLVKFVSLKSFLDLILAAFRTLFLAFL